MYFGTNGTWQIVQETQPQELQEQVLTSVPVTSIMMPGIGYGDSGASTT